MSNPWIGVQLAAPSIFIEGAEHVCNYLASEGGVNAICVGTHGGGYGGSGAGRQSNGDQPAMVPVGSSWADHGKPLPEIPNKPDPTAYIPVREEYYRATTLRHERDPAIHRWADRDVLQELIDAAQPQGIQVYARHLEGFHASKAWTTSGSVQYMQIDVYNQRMPHPCWHHPDYRAWWLAMSEEWSKEYAIQGVLLGPERDAPLGPLCYGAAPPTCFCQYCQAEARGRGIDVGRARTGMRALHDLMLRVADGHRPPDGIFTHVMRLWMKYPEIMAWEQLQNDAKWSLHAEVAGAVRTYRPGAEVGWMVPVYPIKHDIFARAGAYDYAEMSTYSDFIKPNIYQDVNAARLRDWCDNKPLMWRDLEPKQLHELITALFGFHEDDPDYETSWDAPFSPGFVAKEVRRVKDATGSRCKCYAGLGVDIPHKRTGPTDVGHQRACTTAALEAGAEGLLLSRELEFMTTPTLNAVRDAANAFRAQNSGAEAAE